VCRPDDRAAAKDEAQLVVRAACDDVLFAESQESSNMYFCFRWLLILFKREFSFPEIMRIWEVSNSAVLVHVHVCLSVSVCVHVCVRVSVCVSVSVCVYCN